MGSLSCADRTPPRAIPTKNIAANITAIAPSFRSGLSLPICLSKSSWSRRSILRSPFLFIGNVPIFVHREHRERGNTVAVSLTALEQTLGSRLRGAKNDGFSRQFKKIMHQSERSAGIRGLSNGWRRPDLAKR